MWIDGGFDSTEGAAGESGRAALLGCGNALKRNEGVRALSPFFSSASLHCSAMATTLAGLCRFRAVPSIRSKCCSASLESCTYTSMTPGAFACGWLLMSRIVCWGVAVLSTMAEIDSGWKGSSAVLPCGVLAGWYGRALSSWWRGLSALDFLDLIADTASLALTDMFHAQIDPPCLSSTAPHLSLTGSHHGRLSSQAKYAVPVALTTTGSAHHPKPSAATRLHESVFRSAALAVPLLASTALGWKSRRCCCHGR